MMKAKFTLPCLVFLFVVALSSCQQGQRCQEQLMRMGQDAESLFELADSVGFVARIQSGKSLFDCIDQSSDVTESGKGSATITFKSIQEKTAQLPCRCYQRRLALVYTEMGEAEELKKEEWEVLYTRWNQVASTTNLAIKEMRKACVPDDLKSIASMKSQVEQWNGYHMAGEAMEEFEQEFDKAVSTAKGIWKGIEEAIEDAAE